MTSFYVRSFLTALILISSVQCLRALENHPLSKPMSHFKDSSNLHSHMVDSTDNENRDDFLGNLNPMTSDVKSNMEKLAKITKTPNANEVSGKNPLGGQIRSVHGSQSAQLSQSAQGNESPQKSQLNEDGQYPAWNESPQDLSCGLSPNVPCAARSGSVVLPDKYLFPCPMAEDISPCVCWHKYNTTIQYNTIIFHCMNADSNAQLDEIMASYFPVKYFYELSVKETILEEVNFNLNGIKFKRIFMRGSTIKSVSDDFLSQSSSHMDLLSVDNSSITTKTFPFSSLRKYKVLRQLQIVYNEYFTYLPRIMSTSLRVIFIVHGGLNTIAQGAFDKCPRIENIQLYNGNITKVKKRSIVIRSNTRAINLSLNNIDDLQPDAFYDGTGNSDAGLGALYLSQNKLKILQPRTVPFTKKSLFIFLNDNEITRIEPGAFFIMSQPGLSSVLLLRLDYNNLLAIDEEVFGDIFPYLAYIHLQNNPLLCGCDVAWIVKNQDYKGKITNSTTCENGKYFSELSEDDFIDCPKN